MPTLPTARTPRAPIKALAASAFAGLFLLTSCAADDDGAPESTADPTAETDGTEQGLSEAEQAEAEQREEEERVEQLFEDHDAALAGPAPHHREEAAELVAEMSLEQQAGQVIIGEYQGTDAESGAQLVEELHLAGVILMGHNIPGGTDSVDAEALSADIEAISSAGQDDDEQDDDEDTRAVPPVISVDQEGGLVTRVGAPLTQWPTPMAYGAGATADADRGNQLARAGHRHMAHQLGDLGFTISFAPNADVTVGPSDPTIGSRSFSSDPETTAALAQHSIRGLAEAGLAGSIKHFPGHGSVTEDSHVRLPGQQQSLDELRERDWLPFAEAAEATVPMVMMGHIEVAELEAGTPSSLSAAAYQQIRDMGHEGVIVTDAMNMAAIVNGYGGDQAAVDALAAGADLLLMPSSAHGAHGALINAVESGDLDRQRLSEAAERVVALVLWQQELAAGELAAGPGVEVPEDLTEHWGEFDADADPGEVAAVVAEAGLTLVEGECEAQVVDQSLQIAGGSEEDRAELAAAAERAGLSLGSGPLVTLLGGAIPGSGDVVVALDRPDALADSAAETKIALYGRTPESFDALIAVLTGTEAQGALPVVTGEHPVGHTAC